MPKTNTKKRKVAHRVPVYRRPWIIVLFLLAMITAVVCAVLFAKPHSAEPNTTDPIPSVDTPVAIPVGAEDPNDAPTEPEEPDDKPTQYEGEDPNTLAQLTGYLARKGVDDGILTVVAVIDQYLRAPGFCTIVLKNSAGQVVYNASSDAVPDATTSICDAFAVPVTSFTSGTYQIEIHLSADDKYGIITDEVAL